MGQPDGDAAELVAGFIARARPAGRLSEVGVTRAQFPEIAAKTMHDPWLYTNPRKIASPEKSRRSWSWRRSSCTEVAIV